MRSALGERQIRRSPCQPWEQMRQKAKVQLLQIWSLGGSEVLVEMTGGVVVVVVAAVAAVAAVAVAVAAATASEP